MFEQIFYEQEVALHPATIKLKERFSKVPQVSIENVDDIFGRVRKPYLHKRDSLNLFIGKKRGTLLKEAPPAYGQSGDPHYYFIHAYNCIYECSYCYLQGHFNSPDIVLFVNHDEIGEEIKRIAKETPQNQTPWFHAGEFSDSLALSHLTGELPYYFDLFKSLPQAKLELRTKSANIKELLSLNPLKNIITSFSLSPEKKVKKHDLKTAPLKARLLAIKELAKHGHPIGIHLDPIIYDEDILEEYNQLLSDLFKVLSQESLQYISLGVVRFTKDVFNQMKKNYPDEELLKAEFIKSFDNKIRYPRPMRLWILQKVKQLCLDHGVKEEKIYLCMEDNDLC